MRRHIVATVKARLVHHGYRPIETPLIESASVGEAKNAWSSDAPFNLFDDNGALLAVRPDNQRTSVVPAIAAQMSERTCRCACLATRTRRAVRSPAAPHGRANSPNSGMNS